MYTTEGRLDSISHNTMYSPRQILTGIKWSIDSPSLFFRELNKIYHSKRSGYAYNRDGCDFIEENWDTLVILDACRYDMFKQQNTLPGTLEKRISRASHTSQFLSGNFKGQILHDVVYTTASPQLERHSEQIQVEFHKVNNVWDSEKWDSKQGTVPPNDMTKAAIAAHENSPNKRHIIHYMQPHYPFIGSEVDNDTRGFDESEGFDIWNARIRREVDISAEEIWKAYRNNLNLVLNSLEELYNGVNGRIVVTSDHGNMVGERASPIPIKEWGHPARVYTPELIEVPWLIHEDTTRRKVTSEPPLKEKNEVNNQTTKSRLKDLGYL